MISIVIPAYNEALRLPVTLDEIRDYIARGSEESKYITEVIVVDDGSRDNTVEVALYYQDKLPLKVLPQSQNMGKWAAIRAGIKEAKNDWILLLDADGSASVTNLSRVPIRKIVLESSAVFGSRFQEGAVVSGKSFVRTVVSKGYRLYSRTLCNYAVRSAPDDSQAPFKLFKKSALRVPLTVNRFAGDVELFCSLRFRHSIVLSKVIDVPIEFHHKAGSKVPVTAIFQMAFETFKITMKYRKASRQFSTYVNDG